MRRREFISLLGGAAAWPLAARAQQPAKLPTIGLLGGSTAASQHPGVTALVRRLSELGWSEGRTVAIEYRWAEGRSERFADIAAEFVRLKVDVIFAMGTEAALAAKQATATIPIVFPAAGDPVGTGLAVSLSRPGGNVTGLSNLARDLTAKRSELVREIVPRLRRLAILVNAAYPGAALELGEIHAAARTLGFDVATVEIRRAEDIRARSRGPQGPSGGALRRWRPASRRQQDRNRHTRPWGATADDLQFAGFRRSRRPDVLRTELSGSVPPRRRVCGQDSAWGEAGRLAGRTTGQVRADHQPQDGEGARPRNPSDLARPRRRGDRVRRTVARACARIGAKIHHHSFKRPGSHFAVTCFRLAAT
jgi:ABC transporter substrate binding protein